MVDGGIRDLKTDPGAPDLTGSARWIPSSVLLLGTCSQGYSPTGARNMRECLSLKSILRRLLHEATSVMGMPDDCDASILGGALILIFLGDAGGSTRRKTGCSMGSKYSGIARGVVGPMAVDVSSARVTTWDARGTHEVGG
jgi:hypothetical protein